MRHKIQGCATGDVRKGPRHRVEGAVLSLWYRLDRLTPKGWVRITQSIKGPITARIKKPVRVLILCGVQAKLEIPGNA